MPLQVEGTTDAETATILRAIADALDPPPQPEEGDDAPSEEQEDEE